jgi:ribonuclease VapC
MVIDTSAILAILRMENDAAYFARALSAADVRLMSAANIVETGIIVGARFGPDAERDLDLFVARANIEIAPVTADQAMLARRAFREFGKGQHPAGLNFGDCFAYALAKASGEPLLFKGNDFSQTDIQTC